MKIKLIAALLLSATLLQAQTRKDYAVLFPVSNYTGGWTQLPATLPECEGLASDLRIQFGFETTVLPEKNKADIKAKLAELAGKDYGPKDQLLLVFSMHGYFDEAGEVGCLCPAGAKTDDPTFDTWLLHTELRALVARIPCEHILVVLDACYSGTFGGKKGKPGGEIYNESPDCKDNIKEALDRKTRYYIAAGAKERVPAASELVKKIRIAFGGRYNGADGLLSLKELLAAVSEARPTPKDGEFTGDLGGGFVFVPKNGCSSAPTSDKPNGDDATKASVDTDFDGIPDTKDACPKEYGTVKANGCPDRDDDGVPDKADKCVDKPGKRHWQGCPDTDSDGIPDHEDDCPTEKGLSADRGCPLPDRDKDGILDKADKCPDKPGEAHWQGCPDTDSDGIPDHEDDCPTEKGLSADRGCPLPDRDKDGVPDKADKCPDAPGKAHLKGCPDDGFVFVKGGTFLMGCTNDKKKGKECHYSERPSHQVTLSDFYIGKYEVTQAQWRKVMGSDPPALGNKGCNQCPVGGVSWDDVQVFIKKLNQQTGIKYRLPTEAEWEYAARGGNKSRGYQFAGSNYVDAVVASYWLPNDANDKKTTNPVGSKQGNELDIYDMSGNVREWCSDWKGPYSPDSQTNPTGPSSGIDTSGFVLLSPSDRARQSLKVSRVIRGGGYDLNVRYCRVTSRSGNGPSAHDPGIGFRLVR